MPATRPRRSEAQRAIRCLIAALPAHVASWSSTLRRKSWRTSRCASRRWTRTSASGCSSVALATWARRLTLSRRHGEQPRPPLLALALALAAAVSRWPPRLLINLSYWFVRRLLCRAPWPSRQHHRCRSPCPGYASSSPRPRCCEKPHKSTFIYRVMPSASARLRRWCKGGWRVPWRDGLNTAEALRQKAEPGSLAHSIARTNSSHWAEEQGVAVNAPI